MLLVELENDCLERLNQDMAQDGTARTRIRRFLNEWHRRILTTPGLEQLRDDIQKFSSVANQARYALPQQISRINRIYEPNTNRIRLVERSLDWYRNLPTTISGVPECWIPFGRTNTQFMVGGNLSGGTLAFGPTASGLWVVSDNAGDTSQKLYTECFRTGGYLQRDVTSLNGTTRAQINTNTDFYECDKAYIDLVASGNVSIFDAVTAGNELLRIPSGNFQANYLTIVLWPAPSGVWDFYVDYARDILQMMQPTDRPLTSPDFDDILLMGARYSEYEWKKDWTSARMVKSDMLERASALFNWTTNTADLLIVPGQQPRGTRFSNLGSWFPSGSWAVLLATAICLIKTLC